MHRGDQQKHGLGHTVDGVLVRIEHGPEPDGWNRTSFGAWQLFLRVRLLPLLN